MNMTLTTIQRMPEIETSRSRELTLEVEYWGKYYSVAAFKAEEAYKLYDQAIDSGKDRETKDQLYLLYSLLDADAKSAWRFWQDAKANWLALMN